MDLWNYVSNVEVSDSKWLNKVDLKRLVFFNQVLFIGFFAIPFQILTMWQFIGLIALIYFTVSLVSLFSLFLNYKGYSNISKRIFILVVYSVSTYTTSLIGGVSLYHLGAFAIFVSSLVIFDIRSEKLSILMGIPFMFLSICIGEFGWFNAPDLSSHEALGMMRFSSIINLVVVISILTIFILNLNYKNEERLSGRKAKLEDLVQERTEELLAQKNVLEKQNNEKVILLKEVHHRVKNNLQIIVSLINFQLLKYENDDISKALL